VMGGDLESEVLEILSKIGVYEWFCYCWGMVEFKPQQTLNHGHLQQVPSYISLPDTSSQWPGMSFFNLQFALAISYLASQSFNSWYFSSLLRRVESPTEKRSCNSSRLRYLVRLFGPLEILDRASEVRFWVVDGLTFVWLNIVLAIKLTD
jgi:hypothetical protein